jgi:hypothetical protein
MNDNYNGKTTPGKNNVKMSGRVVQETNTLFILLEREAGRQDTVGLAWATYGAVE